MGTDDATDSPATTLRHFLAALAYRFHKSVEGAPEEFAGFHLGHGVRTPLAIVHHMNGVLGYAREVLATGDVDYWHAHPKLDWQGEISALHATLREIDALLEADGVATVELAHRVLQGPLADALTHVGQLALLRRTAGAPLPAENFLKADVAAGRVGRDQADPVSPDR